MIRTENVVHTIVSCKQSYLAYIAFYVQAVYGVCMDGFNDQRLAAFHENVISIWDTRSFERPLKSITEAKNILRYSICCGIRHFHYRFGRN